MQSLISKVGLDLGYNRRINVDLFGDRAEVKALPAKDGYPEVIGVAAHDGAAFVVSETSLAAVAEYAALRKNPLSTPASVFAHAFRAYFIAEDNDMKAYGAAAANFEASASYADNVAEAQADASSNANAKAADSAALAAQKAQEAATATQAAADAAQAHANDLAAAASASTV